jgi:hypothetical protein
VPSPGGVRISDREQFHNVADFHWEINCLTDANGELPVTRNTRVAPNPHRRFYGKALRLGSLTCAVPLDYAQLASSF